MDKYEKLGNVTDYLKSPEFSKFLEEFAKSEKENKISKEQELKILYNYISNFKNFDDYLEDLDNRKKLYIKDHPDEYIESTNEEYDLVKVAFKYGTRVEENLMETIRDVNPFIGSYAIFKGYYFGIMHGQGSFPWWMSVQEVYEEVEKNSTTSQLKLL